MCVDLVRLTIIFLSVYDLVRLAIIPVCADLVRFAIIPVCVDLVRLAIIFVCADLVSNLTYC